MGSWGDSVMLELPARPMTGAAYGESLRDGREVYIDGERVADVTAHPASRNAVRAVAPLYDALYDPAFTEALTARDRRRIFTHKFFKPSYSADALCQAREAI